MQVKKKSIDLICVCVCVCVCEVDIVYPRYEMQRSQYT